MPPTFEKLSESLSSMKSLDEFRDRRRWEPGRTYLAKLADFLAVHGKEYFSPLKPVFLSQLKWPGGILKFSPLLSRDGVLALSHFFYRHPTPPAPHVLILVSSKLAAFVPEEWRDNVAYYSVLSSRDRASVIGSARKVYLLFTIADERQCSKARVREIIRRIGEAFGSRLPEIALYCTSISTRVADTSMRYQHRMNARHFDILSAAFGALESRLDYLSWPDLQSEELFDAVFVDFNEVDFHYSDSFAAQFFLSQGAVPFFDSSALSKEALSIGASFYHRFSVGSVDYESIKEQSRVVRDAILAFRSSPMLVRAEEGFGERSAFTHKGKFCTPSFEALIYDLARTVLGRSDEKSARWTRVS